jgi:ribosomal protein S18 acetylase RimI-like enzyme
MNTPLSFAQIQADPLCIAARLQAPDGTSVLFRPLTPADAAILGPYFCGLSADTISRYGPHPFDQATADSLCAAVNYQETIRFIAVEGKGQAERVIAYFILQPGIPVDEVTRYARAGITLDPRAGCLIAPSVADAYQSRGLGTPLMRHAFAVARRLGFSKMVLMGGVYLTNERAVHYYRKLGFRDIGVTFENPPNSGRISYDMHLDL